MVVLAWGGDNPITLSSPTSATYGDAKPWDTFATTQAVNISGTEAVNLTATLERIVSAVAVRSTDNRPESVTHMRFTYSGGSRSFSPATGLASEGNGFSTTFAYTSAAGGTTYTGGYLFLSSDEQPLDVTIETLDSENGNVLFSKTVTGVPLRRNRITVLTGAIYSKTASAASFQVNSDWLSDYGMTF